MILFNLLPIDFKYRRIIHYVLLVFVIVLQFTVIIVWFKENESNVKVMQNIHDENYSGQIMQQLNNSNKLFVKSQYLFHNYLNNNDTISLEEYKKSLIEMNSSLNKLSLDLISDTNYLKTGVIEKMYLEDNLIHLSLCIDSIFNNADNIAAISKKYNFNKLEYQSVLDTVKTNSYILVLIKRNEELLLLSNKILDGYEKYGDDLHNSTQKKIILQYQSHERIRNFTIVVLILLIFIIAMLLLNFICTAFLYEVKLAKDKII